MKGDTLIQDRLNDKLNRDVYDQIAPGWYNYRHYSIFRQELARLAERWKRGKLLNLGSGHGADFLPFKTGFNLYGMDFSCEMIKLARRYSHKFEFPASLQIADVRFLPYANGSFDWAISIATYHHLQAREDQLAAIKELRRVLKPGGEAMITVWNRWQPHFWFKGKEVYVPWKVKGQEVKRYYYLFTYQEIEALVKEAGLTLLESFPEDRYHFPIKYFSRNVCLLVRR
jgi:tRNA (uracil-5-)-methyltransferase TRM9